MADLEKTLKVIFQGDITDLQSSMKKVTDGIEDFRAGTERITQPLANAADKILKVDAALAALVAGGIALAIRESSNFNQEFALISTSVDATGNDLARYRDEVLEYSTTSVKSISDINAALYTAAQAGIKWGDSLDFISKAEQLAVTNNANLNTTVNLLTGTMNAYGFSVKDVGHLNDVFFTSTLIGKQTIDQLGQSMGMVVGIAANFGVSFESLSAAISTLTAKGMETSEAITAVKGVITSMANPSVEAAKAAAELGLNFSVAELKAVGLEGMLQKVLVATGGNADKMKILFGETRALNGIMQLTGDNLTFFNDALQKINNSTGSAEENYKKMVATFANQSQMIINSAKGVMIEVGEKLEPISRKIAGSFTDILAGLKTGFDQGAFDPLFDFLEQAGAELAAKLKMIAKNLPEAMQGLDFSGLINSLQGLGGSLSEAFNAIFGNIDLTTPEGLHIALQKIIDAFETLVRVTDGIIEGMKPLFNLIGEGIGQVDNMDNSTKEWIGTLIGAGKAVNVLADYAGALTGALGILATKGVVDAVAGIINLGKAAVNAAPGLLSLITNAGTLGSMGAVGAAAGIGVLTGSILNQIPAVQKAAQGMFELIDADGDYFGILPGGTKAQEEANRKFEEAQKIAKQLATNVKEVPETKTTVLSIEGAAEIQQAIRDIGKEFVTVQEEAKISVKPDIDVNSGEFFGEVDGVLTLFGSKIQESNEKNKVKLNPDEIKKDSDLIKTMLEWKAKLELAEVESGTEKMKTMFASLDNAINSTGSTLSSLFSLFSNAGSSWDKSKLESFINKEMDLRKQIFEKQKELIDAEVALLKAKKSAYDSGKDIALKITAQGLEPELEAFMWKIIKKVQIRANESSAEFLLGTGT